MRLSIIVAAYNEGDSLFKTVQSCVETCAGLDYEVIVADDASWDGSVDEAVRRFPRLQVVRNPERLGPSPTKDRGARAAAGEVLVFLDGHAKPERGALQRLVEDVQLLKGRALVTPTIVSLDVSRWRNAAVSNGHGYRVDLEQFNSTWLPLSDLRSVQEGPRKFYESPAAIGCALAVTRELYETLWGFDPDMSCWGVEDVDFSLKCWLMGGRILHDPEATVGHRFREQFDSYEVPLERLVANQLRMARKNFTHGTWADWVDRCQSRHARRLADHPEGLWARAWTLFEELRASVEEERAYLLARRVRDEFWYAERFGLSWPRLYMARVPSAEFGPLGATPSPPPPPPPPGPPPGPPCEEAPPGSCPDCPPGPPPPPPPPPGPPGPPPPGPPGPPPPGPPGPPPPGPPGPPLPGPPPTCVGSRCRNGSASAFPVRYFNGEVEFAVTDLRTEGYGDPWEQRRVYSNQLSYSGDVGSGFNWLVEDWPYLIENGDGTITFVRGTTYSLWFDFDPDTGSYTARYGAKSTLTHDADNDVFILTQPSGAQWIFHDFTQSANPPGLFATRVTPGEQVTEVTSYTGDDRIGEVQRTVTVDGTTTVESFLYQYSTGGPLESVTLRRQVNGGGWQNVRRAVYTYYGPSDSNGSEGDLRTVSREEWNGTSWETVGVSYYRYWLDGQTNGFAHGLRFILGEASYARMIDDSLDPLTASNAQLALYADNYFEYDGSQRVTNETVHGGSQTFAFAYAQSGNGEDPNNWAVKTVETLPDGSQMTVYTNFIGQVLLKELTSGSDSWLEYHNYDADFREILLAEPSAISGYDDTSPDLDVTLKTGDGLLHVTDYYASTGSGAAKGYKRAEKVQRGSAGTPVLLRDWEYATHSSGDVTVHPISKQTVYRNDDGTGAVETSFSYTWYSGTVQRQQQTVTLPAVPAGQNGSGTSATGKMYFDEHGNVTWSMDERGFITRIKYDIPTGAMTQWIDDVDTSIETDAPSGWVTPSGGGLNLVTDYKHDEFGRIIQELAPSHTIDLSGVATTIRRATWTVYVDGSDSDQVWTGQGYATGTSPNYTYTLVNPVSITRRDKYGLVLEEIQATRASTAGKLLPTDSFPQSSYVRWTTNQYTECCLLASTRVYHDIPSSSSGSAGTNYDQTDYGYDSMKRGNRSVSPGGTITFLVYDARSQIIETWIGTDDSGASESDPSGGGNPNNNMVLVTENEYDGGNDGGDGNLTQQTRHVDATTTRVTTYTYDWRDRPVDVEGEIDFFQRSYYDNLDRVVKVERYDTTSTGNLVARSETKFDDRGRVYQTIRYGVDPATGTVGNSLIDNIWYDAAGNEIKSLPAGSDLFTKTVYDSLGRPMARYVGYDLDETSYGEAGSVTGDTILEQTDVTYDDASNVVQTAKRRRYHNAPPSQTGPLGDPSTTPNARVTYTANYPDALGRPLAVADYGTNGGTALSRSSTIPARSDTVLVTSTEYNSRGEPFKTIDPAGKEDRTELDDAGRRTKLIENYVDGNPATGASDEDRTTEWTYTADGQEATITAINSDTGNQTTTYIYGTTLADSEIAASMLRRYETYPDSAGGSDRVAFTYNRQQQVTSLTDQNGSVHSYAYDLLGRQTQDRITTLGTNVDGAVRRIATSYEVRGLEEAITSYDNPTVGQGSIVNEVRFEYNEFAQLVTDYQSHSGTVNTMTTPKVQYAYADGSDNTIRPTSLAYPNGRVITFGYGTSGGIDDAASRVASLIDSDVGSTHLADYSYLGQSEFVEVDDTEPEVKFTLIDLSGNDDPDTGDIYSGLDRFGRIKDNRWYDYGSSADAARLKYGYDRASNRLWREDVVAVSQNKDFDELYAYDGLYRLIDMQRGRLNAQKDAITNKTFAQDWSLDPTGNWGEFREDDNGNGTWDLDQERTANKVNEITDISETTGPSWITPAYDANGSTTTIPQPNDPTKSYTATYDAWNRLVKLVDDDTSNTVQENEYDGRGFCIVRKEYVSGSLDATKHLYYTHSWQCLEQRVDSSSDAERQFVWGLRYIDDLTLRDRDTTDNGTLDERLFAMQDANWNIVAFANASGAVQQRFAYDSYGKSIDLAANFTPTTDSYDWEYRFTSRELDLDTDLDYFRNRYYHNGLGCFISRDPLTYIDGASLYRAYFAHTTTDPYGNAIGCACVIVVGGIILLLKGCRKSDPKPPPAPPPRGCEDFQMGGASNIFSIGKTPPGGWNTGNISKCFAGCQLCPKNDTIGKCLDCCEKCKSFGKDVEGALKANCDTLCGSRFG